jgi:nodulation protein E
VHPLTIPRLMCNAAPSQVSMDLGLRGMSYAVASACASGTHAIGQAFQMIRSGMTSIVIAGGSEACIATGTILGWEAMRVLANDTCRPFAANRSGLVVGEGAAVLVLEDRDHAEARGATILAEIIGFGGNADAGDLTSPDLDNVAAAIGLAITSSGLDRADFGYINAHGTGTMINDSVESRAICQVFGDKAPPVSSSKGVLGHCLGAAGALEAMITVMALHEQILPPTANCEDPDRTLGIDMIPEGPRKADVSAALSNSFAFGGLNAVLAFGRA